MEIKEPFAQAYLNEIFKISSKSPERLASRESSNLEFKESFGWNSLAKYLKTSAAYANTKGGYIVFGIANKPHLLRGLTGESLILFENVDPEKISRNFNEHFSPEIAWEIQEYELEGHIFGLLYIYESKDKPVVCIKDAGKELKECDIYYRYRGRTERIKYPELKMILESKRENEQRLWMHHLESIARIGVREAGIFDIHTGSVTGLGGSFLIDESLLSQLSFIKEGEFSEIEGKPVLKLIGTLEPLSGIISGKSNNRILKTKGIRTSDIILSMLRQDDIPEPQEYIKQICFETTGYLPVYHFIRQSGMTVSNTIEMLEGVISRSATRGKLIERLKDSKTQQLTIPNSNTSLAIKKREYKNQILNKQINKNIEVNDIIYCLQAIRSLNKDEIISNSEYVRELLQIWFNKHYASAKDKLADNLRRAICWIDEGLNLEECVARTETQNITQGQ
ncbi:ATP-binding protein [Sphaerochaeta sp. PS]|uniref:ATP-binding protein n=1 Tax=Sphaerochaeta sp. PS TaxID=3076336 RepID=UPI0028A417EA|nr:ATP-binding protein [Sphaerochaeta sp. PS]MDT4761161.1 ATP-binding protein [Sphaerochaeta sp. PS]